MNESNSKPEKSQKERRYDPELLKKDLRCDLDQLEMLKHCSDKKDMTKWNKWRESHPNIDVWLQGKDFSNWYLKGAYFNKGQLVQGYNYTSLGEVHLENTFFHKANLENALFIWSRLQNAKFANANLKKTKFEGAHIQGTNFYGTYLQDANFKTVLIDNETSFWNIKINDKTNFLGVSLEGIRIHPKVKQLLEYNTRRRNWEDWYKDEDEPIRRGVGIFSNKKLRLITNRLLTWLVHKFWQISDYALRTWRIIVTFFVLAFAFALVYWLLPSYIMVNDTVGDIRGLWHALYFSVVTMTTLGFGDIAANPDSWAGQTLLMVQVILGYILLGALVTRFAVLFTAGGPAGKFAKRTWDRSCSKPKTGWDKLATDKAILQTGDVIHVQNRGLLSKLIRFFSRAWKEEPSWASHTAMVLRVGEEIEIIEALWTTVIRPITVYKGRKSKLLVCRKPGGIGEEQKQKMIEKAEYYKGQTYGYLKIVLHVLDRFLNNRYVFRRLIKDNEYPICSWLVAYVYDRVLKYRFGAPPNAAQPDDLLDHCLDYDWEFIWADSGESVADFCRTYELSDKNDVA